jgi:hypothetical protein
MTVITGRAARPSTDWAYARAASQDDPGFFIHEFLVIDDAQDLGGCGGRVPFKLWPAQFELLDLLQENRQVVILKARQLGISWLICAYVLWNALFKPGQDIFLFSRGKNEAKELLRRIKALYDRLPGPLKELLPALEAGNKESLEWSHGSRIQSMASTPGSGVSFTASIVVMDESAHMTWGQELFGNVMATVAEGGQIIAFSTGRGFGDWFHTLWDHSKRGLNSFTRVFLPWWSRPGRTREWYERERANASDPNAFHANYPATDLEAFRTSGRNRFPSEWLEAQNANLREPLHPSRWPASIRVARGWPGLRPGDLPRLDLVRGLRVYEAPEPGCTYAIAGDMAEGKEPPHGGDPDYDAAVVLETRTWREVASLHGRWEPDEYARLLMALSEPYDAEVIVERNNHGHAAHAAMKVLRFPRIADGPDGYHGWLTNLQSKPLMIDGLAEALRDRAVTVRTAVALSELHVYSVLKDGRTGAAPGSHDDFVMAWAVGLAYLRMVAARPKAAPPAVVGPGYQLDGYLGPPRARR